MTQPASDEMIGKEIADRLNAHEPLPSQPTQGGCPKCGAEWQGIQWACGSYSRGFGVVDETGNWHSSQCRIRELESTAARLTAENAANEATVLRLLSEARELLRELHLEQSRCISSAKAARGESHAWYCTIQLAGCDCNCAYRLANDNAELRRERDELRRVADAARKHIELWTAPVSTVKDAQSWRTLEMYESELLEALDALAPPAPAEAEKGEQA
jgi:hypothetical protein